MGCGQVFALADRSTSFSTSFTWCSLPAKNDHGQHLSATQPWPISLSIHVSIGSGHDQIPANLQGIEQEYFQARLCVEIVRGWSWSLCLHDLASGLTCNELMPRSSGGAASSRAGQRRKEGHHGNEWAQPSHNSGCKISSLSVCLSVCLSLSLSLSLSLT